MEETNSHLAMPSTRTVNPHASRCSTMFRTPPVQVTTRHPFLSLVLPHQLKSRSSRWHISLCMILAHHYVPGTSPRAPLRKSTTSRGQAKPLVMRLVPTDVRWAPSISKRLPVTKRIMSATSKFPLPVQLLCSSMIKPLKNLILGQQ